MSSSKKSLDIDALTFKTMYIKPQPDQYFSSYTIPMIPGNDTLLKQLIFMTPVQALSVGNIHITPSTLPYMSIAITDLSNNLNILSLSVSTLSTSLGHDISSIYDYTKRYFSTVEGYTYTSTYSTIISISDEVAQTDIIMSEFNGTILNFESTLSSLSRQFTDNFLEITTMLDTTYNQGPSVSSLSTYFTVYFSTLNENIPIFSTSVGAGISTNIYQDTSTFVGYSNWVASYIDESSAPGISSMSTVMGSTFSSYTVTLISYNPGPGMSSISTYTVNTLSNYSTLFSINSGIPGICSLSTSINSTNQQQVSDIQAFAGTPGLCTMSTYLKTNVDLLQAQITHINTNTILSTFSTSLYNEINLLSSILCTVGYTYTIIQQELVKTSISTLSTSFGNDYSTMISLTTFSAMLPGAYSSISTAFSLQTPYNTLSRLSTTQYINTSTIMDNLINTYPSIDCRLGVSSLSTAVFSSVSSFTAITNNLLNSYSSISSILWQNLHSPQFSTFATRSLTASSLTVQTLIISSLGINQSTSVAYPFAITGGVSIYPIQPPLIKYVMAGQSTFTSSNIQSGYISTATNQFTGQGNDIAYNGSLWVTAGSNVGSGSILKYSSSPSIAWSDATYPLSGAPSTMNTVRWNGSYWLAGGAGGVNTLLKSTDGMSWITANPTPIMSSIYGLSWNGYSWVAVGADPVISSILYTDTNNTWNSGTNTFTTSGASVVNNGRTWVAVGKGIQPMKYSYDGAIWTDVIGPQVSTGTTVAWNGNKFVAGGSNGNTSTIVYSYDGANWLYASTIGLTQQIQSVLWDGSKWSAINNTNGIQFLSLDGKYWSTSGLTNGRINSQAYASNTIPTLQLPNFDIYSQETPVILNGRKRMNIIQSSIYFNDGDLTIRHVPSTISYACIGINNTYPTYALDIGYGDARKLTGSTWISPSDARVKSNIISANLLSCAKLVADIPLRQYTFTQEFQSTTGVSSELQYGFIAQEVKKVLPQCIKLSDEFGLNDFHSLDTDQLFKAEFGASQYILQKLQEMELQVSTLESRLKTNNT